MTTSEMQQTLDALDLELHRIRIGCDLIQEMADDPGERAGEVLFLIDATRDRIDRAKGMVGQLYRGAVL